MRSPLAGAGNLIIRSQAAMPEPISRFLPASHQKRPCSRIFSPCFLFNPQGAIGFFFFGEVDSGPDNSFHRGQGR
jgi:hypothetical protein